jgi:hypothetical protein
MGEARTITLGGREFDVPPLPLGISMLVYPMCQRLTRAGLAQRLLNPAELEVTDDEVAALAEIAFQAAHAADPTLEVKDFLALPVTPPELYAAFFIMRIQCGGWRAADGTEDGDSKGEVNGATPPTSTSIESLPA